MGAPKSIKGVGEVLEECEGAVERVEGLQAVIVGGGS